MEIKTVTLDGSVEILASVNYQAIPIRLQNSANVYKAGTPVTADGAAALDGTNAVGILLYDVDTKVNPNGAAVVIGIVDYNKIVANASVTASAATLHSAIPAVYFRDNIEIQVPLSLEDNELTVAVSASETTTILNAVGTVTAESSATGKATASVSGTTLTVTGVAEGSAIITVTDANGNAASVNVTVTAAVGG